MTSHFRAGFRQRMLERFAESIDDESRNKLCALNKLDPWGSMSRHLKS